MQGARLSMRVWRMYRLYSVHMLRYRSCAHNQMAWQGSCRVHACQNVLMAYLQSVHMLRYIQQLCP
jgi:hypothetical protein